MEQKDIEHLARLSRIELKPEEGEHLAGDITNILSYVSEVERIVGDRVSEKKVGALYNVMRKDDHTNEPGEYTEDLLNSAPLREGQYLKVKKILEGK